MLIGETKRQNEREKEYTEMGCPVREKKRERERDRVGREKKKMEKK
jgi:hypothetical protein